MTRYIALLRGINVGGRAIVSMADLRALLADMGFKAPRTLLQSGNAVFDVAGRPSAASLEKKLEIQAKERFGHPIDFMLRSADEWRELIRRNPFPREAAEDPAHTLVMVLKTAPAAAALEALQAEYQGPESMHLDDRQLYLLYPEGIGRSRLTNVRLERALGCSGTARNWNTVLKLAGCLDA